jgi:hypothetical protein
VVLSHGFPELGYSWRHQLPALAATSMLAAVLVGLLLLVTFDLDRPTRGLITVPSTPLENVRVTMQLDRAADPPDGP